jgi:SET domain-containing protein
MDLPFDIGISPTLGIRGIIASRDIRAGEVIERCPVILVEMNQEKSLFETVMKKYYFEWTKKYHAVALGYGSLVNHSYTPNARYDGNYRSMQLVFKAINPIKKGEEITINYNWEPDSQDPVDDFLVDFNAHHAKK